MNFLKTLFWIAVAVVLALFAMRNSAPVTVNLWADLQMITPLWVVIVLSFLLGLLPVLALHRTSRWRLRRRLEQRERELAEVHAGDAPTVSPATRSEGHLFGDDPTPHPGPAIVPPPGGF